MKLKLIHHVIKSPVFELIDIYEIDIDLKSICDSDPFSLRIELFRSMSDKKLFRSKIWRTELFRIQSTFPQSTSGKPLHKPSDEMIQIGFSQPHFGPCAELRANSPAAALKQIIKNLGKFLEHVTSEELRIK